MYSRGKRMKTVELYIKHTGKGLKIPCPLVIAENILFKENRPARFYEDQFPMCQNRGSPLQRGCLR